MYISVITIYCSRMCSNLNYNHIDAHFPKIYFITIYCSQNPTDADLA